MVCFFQCGANQLPIFLLLLILCLPIFFYLAHLSVWKPAKSRAVTTKSKVAPISKPVLTKLENKSPITAGTSSSAVSGTGVRIPLHAGSKVFVYKEDLIRIYSNIPAIYTGRLAELVFGKSELQAMPDKKHLDFLEPHKRSSLTSETLIKQLDTSTFRTNGYDFFYILQSTLYSCTSAARFRSPRIW